MGHDASSRALLKSLAWLAAIFAVIFTLNGIGFAMRSSHVDAGDKGGAQKHSVVRRLDAKTKAEASLIARDLKLDDTLEESTQTPLPDAQDAGTDVRGGGHGNHVRGNEDTVPSGKGSGGAATSEPKANRGNAKPASNAPDTSTGPGASEVPEAAVSDISLPTVVEPTVVEPPDGLNEGVRPAETDVLPTGQPQIELPPNSEPTTEPVIVPGNPPLCEGGFKIESPSYGTHVYQHTVDGRPVTITIVVYSTANGQAFNWTSSQPVERVVVKGGSLGANVYAYDPPAVSDSGLHAPQANEKNPHWAGLSYIAFCFGEKPPCDVTKTFKMTYPDLPEGASLWVRYSIGDKPSVLVQLLPVGDGVYSAVVEHIPAGSIIRGEWQLKMGDTTETLGKFCEVLVKDKTNTFSHKAQVCGSKYEDLNGNGKRDEGEPGIAGWKITLLRKAWVICDVGKWEPYATTVTGADGSYCFAGLPPGLYKVVEEERAGWKQTDAPEKCEFSVCADTSITGLDFGNLELPDITVLKFEDVNGNGVRDALPGGELEPALSGWTFTLSAAGHVISEKTTGEDGLAVFADLDLGTYVIDEAGQAGWKAVTTLPVTIELHKSGADVTVPVGNQRIVTTPDVDLGITKASNPATVAPGEMVTYRLTYFNLGETPAEDFKIVDNYDESLVAEVVDAGGGVVDTENGTITWTFAGPFSKADGSRSVVYTVRVRSDIDGDTFLDNVAVIEVADDVDLTNNTAEARVEIEPFLPFPPDEEEEQEEEPFLPFTGAELGSLLVIAGLATAGGLALRRLGRQAPRS